MSNENQSATVVFGGDATGAVDAAVKAAAAVKASVEGMQGSLNELRGYFGLVTKGFAMITAAVAGGSALKGFVNDALEVTASAAGMGKSLGISATDASVFKSSLTDLGVSTDLVAMAGKRVTMALSQGGDKFRALGVQTKESNGEFRNSRDIMLDVNEKLRGFKEGTSRNIEAMKIYGRSYADLAPFINKYKAEVEEADMATAGVTEEQVKGMSASQRYALIQGRLREETAALNLVVGQESVDAAGKYKRAKAGLGEVMEGVKRTIGEGLIPRLTEMAQFFKSNGPAAVSVMRGVMSAYLTLQDAIGDSVHELWVVVRDSFVAIGGAIRQVFGTGGSGLTGIQLFANVMTVIKVGVIALSTGIQVSFALIGSAISQTVDWLATFAEVAGKVMMLDFSGAIDAWGAGMKRREKIIADSTKRVLEIATKGRENLLKALDTDPTAAGKLTATKDPKDAEGKTSTGKAGGNDNAFAVVKAGLDAQLAVKKELLAESLKVTEEAHTKELLDDQQFYAVKMANERAVLDLEAQGKQAERAHVIAELGKAENAEGAKHNTLKAQQVKLEGELAVIQLKRLEVAVTGERDLAKAAEERNKKLTLERVDANKKLLDLDVSAQEEEARVLLAMGAITDQENLARQREVIAARYANDRAALVAKVALERLGSMEREKLDAELLALDKKNTLDLVKNANDAALAMGKPFVAMQTTMQTSFQAGLDSMFDRTRTFGAKMKTLWMGLGTMFVQEMVTKPLAEDAAKEAMLLVRKATGGNARILLDRAEAAASAAASATKTAAAVAGEGAHTGAAVVGAETRVAVGWMAAAQNVAANAWAAVMGIAASAWQAMAATYAAIAAIPVIGPVLAPVAAGAAFVAVAGFAGHVMSASGGYDIPAGVNPMTQLHSREMVLPAEHADTIRRLGGEAGGGGGGSGENLTVKFSGQQLAGGFFLAHQDELVAALKAARRGFKF